MFSKVDKFKRQKLLTSMFEFMPFLCRYRMKEKKRLKVYVKRSLTYVFESTKFVLFVDIHNSSYSFMKEK